MGLFLEEKSEFPLLAFFLVPHQKAGKGTIRAAFWSTFEEKELTTEMFSCLAVFEFIEISPLHHNQPIQYGRTKW